MNPNQITKLIPVIELQPYSFSKVERKSPEKSYEEAPQEWENYNQSCYNDSGLNNIKPIESLSWLFKITSLSEEELKIILKSLLDKAVEDFDSIDEILNDPIEYAPLIPGGYLFVLNDVIKSRPDCCCGLEDISDWKDADTVLTGHGEDDLVYINRNNSQVEISIKKEQFLLSEKEYNKIVKEAKIEIDQFIERSGKLLNDILGIKNGNLFAKSMIYKWD